MAATRPSLETRSISRRGTPQAPRIAPNAEPTRGWTRLVSRAVGALDRRRRVAWRWLTFDGRPPAVPAALAWLNAAGKAGGLGVTTGDPVPCPGATGAGLSVWTDFGQRERASAAASWLLKSQRPDGAFPDAMQREASSFNTAQALSGLLSWIEACESQGCPDQAALASAAARRAAEFLAARIDGQGRIEPAGRSGDAFDIWAGPAAGLAALPPLLAASRRWRMPDGEAAVWRAAAVAGRWLEPAGWASGALGLTIGINALASLGRDHGPSWFTSSRALRLPSVLQTRGGAIPAGIDSQRIHLPLVGQLAAAWYRVGQSEPADRALRWMARQQCSDGGFASQTDRRSATKTTRQSIWSAIHFLNAARWQVRAAFEGAHGDELPDDIATTDGRLVAARNWLAALATSTAAGAGRAPGPHIVDAGCGSGRFLKRLAESFPSARWTGVDPAAALLAGLPSSLEARPGDLLNLPAADGEFDGAMAIESLEHALAPQQAVGELCRVTRPGGSVLIIDKHAQRQALSLHQPWERWFLPDEVSAWLAPYCDAIRVTPVSHTADSHSPPLFLCWQARRR